MSGPARAWTGPGAEVQGQSLNGPALRVEPGPDLNRTPTKQVITSTLKSDTHIYIYSHQHLKRINETNTNNSTLPRDANYC